ncbi:hypothetical protein, partial [Methylobacterium radiotolerans]|uniref:hypothetical protein n=1 Tax=Methylobacterium radiotolerans TaxID=31998 RepID=UPI0015C67A7D
MCGEAGGAWPHYGTGVRALGEARGACAGCYQFVGDVTERRRGQVEVARAQEALSQSQKLEAVGEL